MFIHIYKELENSLSTLLSRLRREAAAVSVFHALGKQGYGQDIQAVRAVQGWID